MFQNKINVANGDRKINLSKRLVSLLWWGWQNAKTVNELSFSNIQYMHPLFSIRYDVSPSFLIIILIIFASGPGLTSDRYYPPLIKGRLAIIYRLLAMFHPRPFLLTRFGPQGTVACIRAENKDYLDIVFRSLSPFVLYILYANGNIYVNPWFLFLASW